MKKAKPDTEVLDRHPPVEGDPPSRVEQERSDLKKKLEILQDIIVMKRMHEISDDDLVN